jgi:hypothetical protein
VVVEGQNRQTACPFYQVAKQMSSSIVLGSDDCTVRVSVPVLVPCNPGTEENRGVRKNDNKNQLTHSRTGSDRLRILGASCFSFTIPLSSVVRREFPLHAVTLTLCIYVGAMRHTHTYTYQQLKATSLVFCTIDRTPPRISFPLFSIFATVYITTEFHDR